MKESLTQAYARSHPAKVAARLGEYEPEEIVDFLNSLETITESSVVAKLNSAKAVAVLKAMSHEEVASLINDARHDDSLTIISYLPITRYSEIVEASVQSRAIKAKLYGYSAKSLGALASPEFIAIEKGKKVSDAWLELDSGSGDRDLPVFVVENCKLLGRLPLMPLMAKKNADLPVERMMIESESLDDNANISSVLSTTFWGDYHVLPVVDDDQRLIGVVSRQQLESVSQTTTETTIGIEQIMSELASAYIMVCAHLLDSLVGNRK
ncbi:MAG: magnesium transporter [Candidatus Azotimanducaceae bacterium]|jgi:magnesium transporter